MAGVRFKGFSCQVDALRLSHPKFQVLLAAQNGPHRVGNLIRRDARRSHLVQQRLKQVIVIPVHQRNPHGLFCQSAGSAQSSKSSPQDHNMG